jgi:alpha-mannosidase
LFNQFHDLAAGSGVGVIYKDAQRDYDQVRWATAEASGTALNAIQARIDTRSAGAVPILIFNPLGWDRSGVVDVNIEMPLAGNEISILDKDNHVVPSKTISTDNSTTINRVLISVKNVPSFGYIVLHAVPGKRHFDTDLKVNGMTLENSFIRVKVDSSNGCITSLYDKKSNFESLAAGACGNELQAFNDHSTVETAWNIDPGTFDHYTPIAQVDSVKLLENTPFRAVIRVSRTWRSSKFVQDIVLYAQSDQVEVVNDVDWHETFVLIKAAFPLAVTSKMATYEIPYGTIERPTARANSWDAAKFEVPALRWADLSDGGHGFSLINEAKYGYDCKDNILRLTLYALLSIRIPWLTAESNISRTLYTLMPVTGNPG